MSIMQDSVADGIGQGGVREVVVPLGRGELARHEGRACPVAVFEDFQQVLPFKLGRRGQAPVVDEEDIRAGDTGSQSRLLVDRVLISWRLFRMRAYVSVPTRVDLEDGTVHGHRPGAAAALQNGTNEARLNGTQLKEVPPGESPEPLTGGGGRHLEIVAKSERVTVSSRRTERSLRLSPPTRKLEARLRTKSSMGIPRRRFLTVRV